MSAAEKARQDRPVLQAYDPTLVFTRLTPGVDNIRYDVQLSPRWCALARHVLFEQFLYHAQPLLKQIYPEDPKARNANLEEFKRRMGNLLIEALTLAKAHGNIEIDLLARIALYKWLTDEMRRQFTEVAVVAKGKIEERSRFHMGDERWSFTQRARLSEYQVSRRTLFRSVGETLFDLIEELEANRLRRERGALFGTEFPDIYRILSSRLLFMENPYDSPGYLEHYVMLGRRDGDAGHVDAAAEVLRELLLEEGLLHTGEDTIAEMIRQRQTIMGELHDIARDLRNAEGQFEAALKSREKKGISSLLGAKEASEAEVRDLRSRVEELRTRQEQVTAASEELREKIDFARGTDSTHVQEILSAPVNAAVLFGDPGGNGNGASTDAVQNGRCRKLFDRLKKAGTLPYVLASYQIRKIYKDFCPPLNIHQLKSALVEKTAWKEMETALKQFPSRNFPLDRLAELAQWIRKARFEDAAAYMPQFARDFMRLQQDFRHYNTLSALMESINLLEDEKTVQISRMNHSLYAFVLAEERESGEERVLNHVIIKADIRDSTSITQRLADRGLNPATHFSQTFFDPVHKLMAKYNAAKVFLEGDALILGIFETDSSRSSRVAVGKACLLAKEMVQLTNEYNRKASANNLPALELGLGVVYQTGSPHYWTDGETQIMISHAINQSDRLSGCSKLARTLLDSFPSPFRCALFQGPQTVYGDDKEGTRVRYNVMGVMVNTEGFRRLQQEISLETVPIKVSVFGVPDEQRIHVGTVPIGARFEPLLVREARIPRIDLSDAATPRIDGFEEESYYEICVDPGLYQKYAPQNGG